MCKINYHDEGRGNSCEYGDKRDPASYAIIGAAMEVHRELGQGLLEAIYQDALACELRIRGISFEKEINLKVNYKGEILPSFYRADFVCYGSFLAECKALKELSGTEEAQILNYLKITSLEKALLLNFGTASLQFKRYILSAGSHRLSEIKKGP
jgi:GxxExxY protein